jgi:hypothetical protein
MAGDKILSREDIVWGIERIRAGLLAQHESGALKIIGGSAMILGGHAEREATVDIDAVVLIPQHTIDSIARTIALERGWPENWINLEARGLYPAYAGRPLWTMHTELSDGVLTVELATPEALLAMKLNASRRGRDDDDIRALMTECGITTIADADQHFAEYFRGESLPDKAVLLLRRMGYPDGDDALYRHIAHSRPLTAQVLEEGTVRRSGAASP